MIRGALFLVIGALALGGCATAPRGVPPTDGIPNFAAVDSRLYRSAQPDAVALESLANRGVGTIINLRAARETDPIEVAFARAHGIAYISYPLSGLHAPTRAQVADILHLIDVSVPPVLIHCQYGADRTGMIIACYRVSHDGWTADRALAEADRHGMWPWLLGMRDFVRTYPAQQP